MSFVVCVFDLEGQHLIIKDLSGSQPLCLWLGPVNVKCVATAKVLPSLMPGSSILNILYSSSMQAT